ncbi:guanine deaminase [Caulobacter ginsengisoli]|uniref:Guanine deaminase n=1 Tax=Caulobacter ginsengisoli TaxID=400775 RepID=A0ABU0IRR9_9CAUL|nr:guanine deaminase [Caulobacter ginsengisoli]MDQ0464711.1 guanine deaminase [Caulobacter ginsengisoli]
MSTQAFRASLLTLLDDPRTNPDAVAWHEDGLLLVEDGQIVSAGPYAGDPGVPVEPLPGRILIPGLIDTHIHFPQTDIIASYGAQLLDWLKTHTFPAEQAFVDPAHAARLAEVFLDELLRNGTTTAMVFGTVHKASVDALFAAALARNMRLIAGKCLMDHGPEGLRDAPDSGRADSEALIRDWSRRGRLGYAITPRFALSSSREQLTGAGEMLAAHDHVWLQTHLSENPTEIRLTAERFPEAKDYLDVYDRHGLVTDRSVFAHGIHLRDREVIRMAAAGSAVAFCPTSNLFLGSGLFDLARCDAHGLRVAMGTDVGAGTSFSLFATLAEAYKVGQLRGSNLDPFRALYLATLGGARALNLQDRIGSLQAGREADFLVLDPAATPLLARRTAPSSQRGGDLMSRLFALIMLADDRAVERTYVMGRLAHQRA